MTQSSAARPDRVSNRMEHPGKACTAETTYLDVPGPETAAHCNTAGPYKNKVPVSAD
jgi:hypothetical protein